MSEALYKIPDSVIEDTHAFKREVEKYETGELSAVAFRGIRVPMGIYEQRENDTYMVRVRGAAGMFLSDQVKRIAELSTKYGNGIVHVTTRQDLQIHQLKIHDTPAILDNLLETGLSSRGGGGNTVRNISACPRAGVCPDEVFDVTPYALALTEYLICERGNFNLPRKLKIAFSGCGKDCGMCSVADLGFFAHERDGSRGFAVYAGGGMGSHPALGVLIENFVPDGAIFEVSEAIKRLFDKYGNRANRNEARLRFVVKRFGPEEFRELYRDELEQVRKDGISVPGIHLPEQQLIQKDSEPLDGAADPGYFAWFSKNVLPQKQHGLYSVRIPLSLGNIPALQLSSVADLAAEFADGVIRTTQEQNLRLQNIPGAHLIELYRALRDIEKNLADASPARCVACAGASTCKLGLCLSRGLARAIEEELSDIDIDFDSPVRISGCPNSCGHHPISPIGFYGSATRIDGRLVPYYVLVANGHLAEGQARLAQSVARIPAHNVPSLVKEFCLAAGQERLDGESLDSLIDRWGLGCLQELQAKYKDVPQYEKSPEFYRDFGSCQDFSLAGRGPGECGAGVTDVIALDIDQAKQALDQNALYDAVLASARALLVTRGLEPKKDREVFAAFSEHLIVPGWVSQDTQGLLDAALDFRLGDRETLDDMQNDVRGLVKRVEKLFASLDSNLNFRVDKADTNARQTVGKSTASNELDLRGVACPMNFVKAKIRLETIPQGDVLDILLDDGEPVRNVPASFAEQGQEVLSVAGEADYFRARVRRKQ